MKSPLHILSENSKCGVSINMPIKRHCRPTKVCAFCCYARTGRTAFPASTRKQDWVSQYLAKYYQSGQTHRRMPESYRRAPVRVRRPEHGARPGSHQSGQTMPGNPVLGHDKEIGNSARHKPSKSPKSEDTSHRRRLITPQYLEIPR